LKAQTSFKCEQFLELYRILKMSSASHHVLTQPLSETRGSFVNWTWGKLFHDFSSATFNSETIVGFRQNFQKVCASLPTCYLKGFIAGEN